MELARSVKEKMPKRGSESEFLQDLRVEVKMLSDQDCGAAERRRAAEGFVDTQQQKSNDSAELTGLSSTEFGTHNLLLLICSVGSRAIGAL